MAVINIPKLNNEPACTADAAAQQYRVCCRGDAPKVFIEMDGDGTPVALLPESARVQVLQLENAGGPITATLPTSAPSEDEAKADFDVDRWKYSLELADTSLGFRHLFMIWFRFVPPATGAFFDKLHVSTFQPVATGVNCPQQCDFGQRLQ